MSGQYPERGGSADRSRQLFAEVGTALGVAAVVASVVVFFGVDWNDDGTAHVPVNQSDTLSESPTPSDSPGETPGETEQPPGAVAEVTNIALTVDQPDYVGPCPVTVTFAARITTNTGPVLARYRWLDVDSNVVDEDTVQFGGPGPQGVTVTQSVEVPDDVTVLRRLEVTEPNSLLSDAVEATITCTPTAEVSKGGDDFTPSPCTHVLHFSGAITVPHDMTVTYTWDRSDGAIDTLGPYTLEFASGGQQTKSVPEKIWTLGATGEFGLRLHILEPFDVTSNWATYAADCSGPAS